MNSNTPTESYSSKTKDFLYDTLLYRKRYNDITGSVTASILLNQIIWRYDGNKEKPFFKFIAPCVHRLYRKNDSWLEELGFTKNEFIGAIDRIATKIAKGVSKSEVMEKTNARSLVVYWTESDRVTYWEVNTRLVNLVHDALVLGSAKTIWDKKNPSVDGSLILDFGSSHDLNPKSGFSYVNPKSGFSKSENRIYIDHYSEKNTESVYTEEKQPSHTPEDFDQISDPPQDLETPIPDSPQDLNLEQPELDNNPNPVSKNPDREINSAAAPRENAPIPADFAPCAPFYGLPDESAIISVWNAKKGKKWRRMGSGCMNGNMIEGLRHFMSQAGGDKALAVEFLGKAIEVAAQDDWLGTKNIRPSQGLDPFSQMFMGHFLPDALATDEEKHSPKPVPVPKDFKLTSFVD